jgi:thiamine-phosphate pyrophosphorylase
MLSSRLREGIHRARLYVLVDQRSTEEAFSSLVRALVDAGAGVLQLRAKQLGDRDLLARARLLRQVTRRTDTLFIINDRPDLAVLAEADGVHVGQDDLAVEDARRIVGPDSLVGVSTHSLKQARRAIRDGADYIGCGPTFPSTTKHFEDFPGLDYLRALHDLQPPPAFAIGGIREDNLLSVLETGIRRVAIGGAVIDSQDPAEQVRKLTREIAAFSP